MTDPEKEQLLRDFFQTRLMPLAELARERKVEFFPFGPDATEATYYIDRNDNGNYVHEIDSGDLAKELRAMWSRDNLPEIAGLAEDLVSLAKTLHEEEDQSEDVSPFIYAMF